MKRKYLLPNIILSVILVGIVLSFCAFAPATKVNAEDFSDQDQVQTSLPSAVYEEPLAPVFNLPELVETSNPDELLALIDDCGARKEAAHTMAEGARGLDYPEDHDIIELARAEWNHANTQQKHYQQVYDELEIQKWEAKREQYPDATYVWLYLKDLGYNDYVCAGIMGNLMAECGGQTLNLQVTVSGNGYYGMCQWNRVYCEGVWGKDLEGQCNYLRDSIQYEIDTFGFVYRSKFKYADFLEIENERDAALAFSKTYERCGSGSYSVRQNNATKAYEFFVG